MSRIQRILWFLPLAIAPFTRAEVFVPDRQYRFCEIAPTDALPQGKCSQATCDLLKAAGRACTSPGKFNLPEVISGTSQTRNRPFKIAFLEYDDRGKRWDLAQRAVVKAVIEEAREDGTPLTLIIYAHGWENNANLRKTGRADVEKFTDYVATYADQVIPSSKRRILGVYMAWHGRSLDIAPWLDWVSFWTRGISAGVVGNGDLRQDVNCVVNWGKDPLDHGKLPDCQPLELRPARASAVALTAPPPPLAFPDDGSELNRIILKGHSFGGRVLDHALLSKSNGGTIQAKECVDLEHRTKVLSKIDLFELENAATGGVNVWKQADQCQPCKSREKGCADFSQKTADFTNATMAQSPAFDGRPEKTASCANNPDLALHERCQPYPLVFTISGKKDFLTRLLLPIATLGQVPASFFVPLQTHEAIAVKDDYKPDILKGELFKFQSESGQFFLFRRKAGRFAPVNPIWTLDVDSAIIKDHGDVWNKSVLNLEMHLMDFGNPQHREEVPARSPAVAIPRGTAK